MTADSRTKLAQTLTQDEGVRLTPYRDTVGVLTIGVGHNLEAGITPEAAQFILQQDISAALALLDARVPWWRRLDEVRQRVLANMAFNLGARVLGFGAMLAALEDGDYEKAADEMLDSVWAFQVKARATRLAHQMRTGIGA